MVKMQEINVKIQYLVPWVSSPAYDTAGSAGCDLSLALQDEAVLYPQEITSFSTGIALKLPDGYEAQIRSRAGMARKGLIVANAPATIDSAHVGEISILLLNTTNKPIRIVPKQKVAQMVFAPVVKAVFSR
jgi:dUTP pyrophosphatase